MSEWISVVDRLPVPDKDVLLCFENSQMAVGGKYELDDGWYSITDAEYYTDCDTPPAHWMPLPEPPGGKAEKPPL